MSIRIRCICGARLKAPAEAIGRSVRCSVCGSAIYVPSPGTIGSSGQPIVRANGQFQAWIRVECDCGKIIKVPPEWAGKTGHCPACGVMQTMPEAVPSLSVGLFPIQELSDQKLPAPAPPSPRTRRRRKRIKLSSDSLDRYARMQAQSRSGLLDLGNREEVKIIDGVPPEVWDAKRDQRAKAMKHTAEEVAEEIARPTFADRLGDLRQRLDRTYYFHPEVKDAAFVLLLTALMVLTFMWTRA